MATTWTLFGTKIQKPRPSMSISAVAVIFAAQTFVPSGGDYPIYMCVIAWLSAAWICYAGYKSKALIAFLTIPVSLLWLNPLLGGDWFATMGVAYLLIHSALALTWAVCAYTFLATEKE
jgi:hypothetical protein